MLWSNLLLEADAPQKSKKRPYERWTYDLRDAGTLNLDISNVY